MKNFTKSIHTAFFERLNNPLLGTFFLAWLFVNKKGLVSYYLGTDNEKKEIIQNFDFWDYDLLYAMSLVFLYVVISQFLLPLLQHNIDKLKLKYVDILRFAQRSKEERAQYLNQAKVSRSRLKSTSEYYQKRFENDLTRWGEERVFLREKIKNIEEQLAMEQEKLKGKEQDYIQKDLIAVEQSALITMTDSLLTEIIKGQNIPKEVVSAMIHKFSVAGKTLLFKNDLGFLNLLTDLLAQKLKSTYQENDK